MEANQTLADRFFALNARQRRVVHFFLCEHALEKWKAYVNTPQTIEYVESVVGTLQVVDKHLPMDAFSAAQTGTDSQHVSQRYSEPLAALQDEDLVFPGPVEFAYYAIYNLFQKYAEQKNIDDWLIVNQAISSEEKDEMWNLLLSRALAQAT